LVEITLAVIALLQMNSDDQVHVVTRFNRLGYDIPVWYFSEKKWRYGFKPSN